MMKFENGYSFNEKGYPIIKIFENHFEIKAIDFWKFRSFNYNELKEVKVIDFKEKWWYRLYISTSLSAMFFSENDPIKLKVVKLNKGDWEYKSSCKYNLEFNQVINFINRKINFTSSNH